MADLDEILAGKIGEPDDVVVDDEPAVEAEPDVADQDDAPDGTEMTAAEERLYAGKYKNADELEKAYLEAQRLISQRQAPASEPEEAAEAAPQYMLPLGGDPLSLPELEEWATRAPKDAALWAMENLGGDPELQAKVVRHWSQADPDSYVEYKLERQMGGFQQQLMQSLAPQMQFVQQQQQQAMLHTLQSTIPDWSDKADADGNVTPGVGSDILAAIQAWPQAIPADVWQGGMVAVAQFVNERYGNSIRYARYQAQVAAQQQAAPPVEAQPARGSRAVTQTSSGAAAPAGNGQPSMEDLKAGVLAGIKQAAGGGVNLG